MSEDDNVLRFPVLPYGGEHHPNSGHAGSDTSEERAERQDSDGTTTVNQRNLLRYLAEVHVDRKGNSTGQRNGVTWREYSTATGLHHGATSGLLSTLHKEGHLARLRDFKRDRCKVYVLPSYVDGRVTDEPGKTATTLLTDELAAALRGFMPKGSGCPWHRAADPHDDCRFCVADQALAKFEARRKEKK